MKKYEDTQKLGGKFQKWWEAHPEYQKQSKRSFASGVTENSNIDLFAIAKEYNIKGFEYGRWCSSLDRHDYANAIAATLKDLAKIMGSKNIGFEGRIGIAFGARGRGGRVAAHYEPGSDMINLTKTNGDHSLAHEYGHALDYDFGRYVDQHSIISSLSGGDSVGYQLPKNENGQLRYLVNKIIDNIKATDSYSRLKFASDYWHERTEVFARFFEQLCCYILRDKPNIFLTKTWKTYISLKAYLTESDFKKVLPDGMRLLAEMSKFLNGKGIIKKQSYWKKPSVSLPPAKKDEKKIAAAKVKKNVKIKNVIKDYKILLPFTDPKSPKPALTGIFLKGGFAVATDGHILVKVRCEYPLKYDGKIVDKNGNIIKAEYPKYEHIIPSIKDRKHKTVLKATKVKSVFERGKNLSILNKKSKLIRTVIIFGNETDELFLRYATFKNGYGLMKKIVPEPIMYWNKSSDGKPALFDLKENGLVIMMPSFAKYNDSIYFDTPEVMVAEHIDPAASADKC